MSILRRTQQLSACAALAAFAAFAQAPTNLYLLPNSSSASPTIAAFRTDPLSIFTSFAVQPGASFLHLHPNGLKLYSVARSGSDTLLVLDAVNPGTVIRRIGLGQAEASALSPDGRRLLVAAGSLHIIDTTNDTVISALSDVGNSPIDVAVSLDGSRAFVLSQASNRLTAVDLNSNTVVSGGTVPIPGLASGVAVGPNGLVYVTTVNLIKIIDGATMTVVKEISLNASPGKLVFTPDGQYGFAVNRTPVTGSSVLQIDLAGQKLQGSIPNFQVTLDRLLVAGNNRIYGISNQRATLYEITSSPLNINPPQFSGISDLPNVTDMAVSGEVPNPRFLFVSTPGSLYRFEMSSYPPLSSGQAAIPTQPGPLVHLAPQTSGTPTSILAYNTAQTTVPSGTYRPLIVRVTNSVGKPLVGVPVVFTSDNPNAQIAGASTTTNAEGWAQTVVTAPGTTGTFTVTASAGSGSGQPTASFILTTSTGSSGGSTTAALSIGSGQGQMVSEQFLLTEPMTVVLRDNNGAPVSGQTVTFALASGAGTLATSTFDGTIINGTTCSGNVCEAVTDADGKARASFLATSISPGFSFSQQTISASNGQATVNFIVTTLLSQLPGGGQAAQPLADRIKPTGNLLTALAGTVLNEAIQVRVVASSGIQSGQPIPNVALRVRAEATDPTLGPTAYCVGDGNVALTDSSGLATCNLKAGGKLGRTTLNVNVGGVMTLGGGTINLEVQPGPPSVLRILQGNNQSGNPGQRLTQAFLVEVQDGFGNALPGQSVTWEVVTPNSITLSNVVNVSDNSGRVSALGTLGNVAGQNQVRLKIGALVQTFNFTVNLTISQLNKLSGDAQSTLINQAFAAPLAVEVRDERGNPAPGQPVVWSVVSGSASVVGNPSVSTDSTGRSSVSVNAGNIAGTVTVRAALGSLSQTFTLTVRPPGPVFTANGIVTTARNLPGISPCGLATIYGSNLAIGINGVVNTNFLGIGGLPLTYNNLEIVIGGSPAPIIALANQGGAESVVVQVPCEIAAPGRTSVTIRIPGAQSQVDNVQVYRAAPGLFETPATANQRAYAAVVRPDGSYVTPANPARRGEIVQAAVTGLGQTAIPAVTNRVGLAGQTVSTPLIVGLNDQGVRLVSATYAPGMVGVYWVAFEIPADANPGANRSFAIAAESTPGGDLVYGNSSVIASIQ